jgi:glycosyltransferase involved in cell wall biosynthesis
MEVKNKFTVSCIIPTYNEELHIGEILKVLSVLQPRLFCEVIVIDDGSTDKTKQIVKTFESVTLLENKKNSGKSNAVARGVGAARGDLIFMCDGDLIGLKPETIMNLVEPVSNGVVDISISYRDNTAKWWVKLFLVETFSGERCFHKKIIVNQLNIISALPGYGLEVFINNLIIKHKLRIVSVRMKDVTIDYKWYKHGLLRGLWLELLMWKQIFSVVSPYRLATQVYKMRRLVKKL